MVGFALCMHSVGAPIFAHLSKTMSPYTLMGIGLLIWCSAVLLSGVAQSYAVLLVSGSIQRISLMTLSLTGTQMNRLVA